MRVHNVEQNSDEWIRMRLGIPTASSFFRIITPTGQQSKQADGYANELIAEMMLARSVTTFAGNRWTERGKELEPQAALEYEVTNGVKTRRIGFCTNDEGTMGASPDREVGADGLLEIKCVKPSEMAGYLLTQKLDADFKPQIQGELFVTGRVWVDFKPFHPDMPATDIRVERDEEYLVKMKSYMDDFFTVLTEKKNTAIKLGYLDA